jgi:hypothetical protein
MIIPIANIIFVKILYRKRPNIKKIAPTINARIDMISMNLEMSLARGLFLV